MGQATGTNKDKDGSKNMHGIEARMTSDQVAEAHKLAREWAKKHGKSRKKIKSV